MRTETIELLAPGPGHRIGLTVYRFGKPGARPKAMIQAALHADEIPPLLVAQQLRSRLAALDAAGDLHGEVVLVPFANPLGLGQQVLGLHQGRFDVRDGVNFNRQVPDLSATVADAVAGRLGDDPVRNVEVVRAALRAACDALTAEAPAQDLKRRLLRLAVDADIVLDLHCDAEAVMHLYALTPQSALAEELGALLGAQAVLLATDSGDSPFDEACSRPWLVVQQRHPDHPLPLACFSPTVELRGEADTNHALAAQDADAIVEFLRRRGIVAGTAAPLPPPRCAPTPLAAAEQLDAPAAGVVVFHARPGDRVEAGARVADLVDIDSGAVQPLVAQSAGLLYARMATRWATPGRRVAGIAGTTLQRSGKLLGP
jgi:uncharacterized protein